MKSADDDVNDGGNVLRSSCSVHFMLAHLSPLLVLVNGKQPGIDVALDRRGQAGD